MSQEHRRLKKLERHKKKRQIANRRARSAKSQADHSLQTVAAGAPFGPAFVTEEPEGTPMPAPILVAVTRLLPNGRLLPIVAIVDRTCLGLKYATLLRPLLMWELAPALERVSGGGRMVPCEALVAQSVVFHAVDYARSLGFEPSQGVSLSLFGPRPDELIETPFSHPRRPFYIAGPHDDAEAVMARLDAAVGPDNYTYYVHGDDGELRTNTDMRPGERQGERRLIWTPDQAGDEPDLDDGSMIWMPGRP